MHDGGVDEEDDENGKDMGAKEMVDGGRNVVRGS